jgi:acetoin utilization deacetylase AcuC-like enzyme
MAKDTLGLVFFPAFDWMLSPGHPERQERLLYTRDQLEEEGIFDCEEIREYRPRLAELKDLQRAHVGVPAISRLITPAHLTSAGGCLTAADAVMQGEVKRAFALVRPPGHHAMRVVHGIRGFCTINIEAIMVEYLRSRYGVRKIAVVDTDVHHGDGSQDIFYHDPDTLYISFHQDGRTLYPGTGFPEEAGSPAAWGTTLNLPLLPGTGDEGLHRLYDGLIKYVLEDFQPELIINSAGQDNHFSDPLASMQITAQGYARLADKLRADIAVLEGGYSVESALPYVNTGIILAMAGMDYSRVLEPDRRQLRPQTERCAQRVEQLIKQSGELYFQREARRQRLLAQCDGVWQRRKHIYYDEEGIREEQIETVRYCRHRDCGGYFTLQTAAEGTRFGDQSAFIVCLPRGFCQHCYSMAYDEALAQRETGKWQYVLMQDIAKGTIENI